ncbi:hypothetical protein [Paraburkholderia lacunae]|uniref:hypothetical protein n=1 Tax=Paraburkholderia lacunae TaxID=2211104 RepID=UPI0014040C1E|nr:hypothetical protein [Paraburkholderia lacunae]
MSKQDQWRKARGIATPSFDSSFASEDQTIQQPEQQVDEPEGVSQGTLNNGV